MKKNKLLSGMLAVTMVAGMISAPSSEGVNHVIAAESFKIVSPTGNSLKPAGYILVDWTDVEGATGYKLYVDNKQVATATKSEAEFYNTEVKMHTAYVTATLSDGSTVNADEVTFGVSKKGLAVNDVMGRFLDPAAMNTSWYYSWGTSAFTHSTYDQIEFVPMIWGVGNDGMIPTIANRGDRYLLAYNEPDMHGDAGGSNTDVNTVLNHWPNFLGYDFHLGGPAPAFSPSWDNGQWARDFYGSIDLSKIDFIPLHCYYGQYGGAAAAETFLKDVVDTSYNLYHKPIWITEFAPSGWGYNNEYGRKQCYEFMEAVSKGLDERSYVERYSWFSFDTTDNNNGAAALWTNSTGELTELGELYTRVGLPEGYKYTPPVEEEKPYTTAVKENKSLLADSIVVEEKTYDDYIKKSGVSISASSETGGNVAAYAIDENIGSRWESVQGVDPQYITIDLGQVRNIKQMDIIWEAAQARDYTILVSEDGKDFEEVASLKNLVSLQNRNDTITFNSTVAGRYIRINGTARNLTYGYSIYDIAIYGTEQAEEKIPAQILGFQYNTDLNGFRVLYSTEKEINGKEVIESGNIFAYDKTNDLKESDLVLGSEKDNVKYFAATSKGVSQVKHSSSSTATDYIMTFIKNGTTKEAYSRKYIVRTYAKLSDGSVVYSEPKAFSIFDIVEELYTQKLMGTSQKHDFLYDNILTVVQPNYTKINY